MKTTKKPRRSLRAVAALAASAFALSACSGGSDPEKTVVMYSSANETTVGILQDSARDNDLKLDLVTGSSGPLLERIKSESKKPKADIFFGAPVENLAPYEEYATPVESSETEAIDPEVLEQQEGWIPINGHVVAFMVNTTRLDVDAPTSWEDLLDPKLKGKIIVASPEDSSTALVGLYAAYKTLGEDDFKKLVDNLEVSDNSGNIYPAVSQGEYQVSIGYEANIYPYVANKQPGIEMNYPTDGTAIAYDCVYLVKDSPNPQKAAEVVDQMLSKDIQIQELEDSFRRPVRTDIDPSDYTDFKSLDDLTLVDIDTDEDEAGREEFLELWKELTK
ncbi:extracellular solute-binding protein [Galactobacter sp.]|uniref:extracellular solute-binding protein n=1 Tax=Galactobacter sp. TaxID=2676125 RepID=UPI0025BD728B|nr:extracellular solute-binding protein [Galactobacter sp.]